MAVHRHRPLCVGLGPIRRDTGVREQARSCKEKERAPYLWSRVGWPMLTNRCSVQFRRDRAAIVYPSVFSVWHHAISGAGLGRLATISKGWWVTESPPKERDLVFLLRASMAGRVFASDSGTGLIELCQFGEASRPATPALRSTVKQTTPTCLINSAARLCWSTASPAG